MIELLVFQRAACMRTDRVPDDEQDLTNQSVRVSACCMRTDRVPDDEQDLTNQVSCFSVLHAN